MPDLTLVVPLLVPALAIAIIALVQAAGVSQSVPNPDGEFPDPSGDFRGQGIANVAVGFVGGIPVGGSLSGTTLIKSVGGQSRWANIFTGLFGLLMVLLFAPLLEQLPLPALAGLLVMVGFSMINFKRMRFVSHTGAVPMTIMIVTFVATLTLPIQYAVALGVIFHILLYVYQSAENVRLEQIVVADDGSFSEGDPPDTLTSNEIVALRPVGSLFFAGAAQFEEDLPDVGDAQHAVVILDLRDRTELGSTFIRAIERYLYELHAQDNLLMLADVEERALEQLEDTNLLNQIGRENVFPVESGYGGALRDAIDAAEAWIAAETA
jgi:SulP family sulfate permease